MIRSHERLDQRMARRPGLSLAWIAMVAALLLANSAFGISLTLSQVGGSAIGGRGVVGDTVDVAVDFTIEEHEAAFAAFANLWWDSEGGNVLDVVSSTKGRGMLIGGLLLAPITDRYILSDSSAHSPLERNDRFFENGSAFHDTHPGTTFMEGYHLIAPGGITEEELLDLYLNGFQGPATIRMGVATFRLSSPGTTTLGFFTEEGQTHESVVLATRGETFSNDEIQFTDIPISSVGFGALQIVVVPEPSTAILLGLGLVGCAVTRRH